MGRKPRYETAEEMQEAIDQYFKDCDTGKPRDNLTKKGEVVKLMEPIPYTIEGMAVALGFSSRKAFYRYKTKDPESDPDEVPERTNRLTFGDTIARARLRVKAHRIEQGLLGYQESKVVALDLAVNFKMQPKLELPEGAQIIIGDSTAAPAAGELPGSEAEQQPPKVEQITE